MRRLARWAMQHRLAVVITWAVLAVAMPAAMGAAGADFNASFSLPGTDSQTAVDLLEKEFPQASGESDRIVWRVADGSVTDEAVVARVEPALREIAKLDDVLAVVSPYSTQGAAQISADGKTAFAVVQYASPAADIPQDTLEAIVDAAHGVAGDGLQVEAGGPGFGQLVSPDIGVRELAGVLIAAIILFLVFRSVAGMLIPLATAVISMMVALGLVVLSTNLVPLNQVAPTITVLLGLGVGIDYALFIVHRTRRNLQRGLVVEDAIGRAMDTSGRAVIFAGLTVVVALLGLLLMDVEILSGLGAAAALGVIVTVAASITLLPAILRFAGTRILSRRQRRQLLATSGHGEGDDAMHPTTRRADRIGRRPWTVVVVSAAVLLVLCIPIASLRLGVADQGTDPVGTSTRKAYDMIAEGFGPGFNGPLAVVVDRSSSNTAALVEALRKTKGVAAVGEPVVSPNGAAALIQVVPISGPQEEQTSKVIRAIREDAIPASGATAYVGSVTATLDDFSDVLAGKFPWFAGFVIALSFLVLVVAFRSIIIPLLGAAMNVLSAVAAFGAVVAVFQWGWGASLLNVATGPVEPFIPVLAFAILFGLSMDYQVFLISRVREEWVRTGDASLAVRIGQSETGRVITTAALIMVVVFASFVLSDARGVKLTGFSMAVAVLLDAFVVRSYLVPGLLHLLGRRAWWLPAWLDRHLPRLSVEGPADEENSSAGEQSEASPGLPLPEVSPEVGG